MGKIIDFQIHKEEKEHSQEIKSMCKELLEKIEHINERCYISDYCDFYTKDSVEEFIRLNSVNEFNEAFLYLVHLFMEEECPHFGMRFEIFLDKIRDE